MKIPVNAFLKKTSFSKCINIYKMPKHTATVCQNADISKYFYLKFYKTLVLIKHQVEHLSLENYYTD